MYVSNPFGATAVPFRPQTTLEFEWAVLTAVLQLIASKGATGIHGTFLPFYQQSSFGDKLLRVRVGCPRNGTAVPPQGLSYPGMFFSQPLYQHARGKK